MVTLKERRPLIVCHREMPLSLIDIRNLETLALAGAVLCSPNPGFYLMPRSIDDLVDFVVGKVLDLLKVEHGLKIRWGNLTNETLSPLRPEWHRQRSARTIAVDNFRR